MEVAIGSNNSGTPFQREIREWQRIDPNTGALLSGRLEADRWISGPLNAYGKVVDSQNVSQPNGTQHTQRKQLEVLQAHTTSGSMQVIRAQTVQTTSSRWSSSISSTSASAFNNNISTSSSSSSKLKSITSSAHASNKSIENEYNNKSNYNNDNSNNIISKKQFKSPITNGFSTTIKDSNNSNIKNATITSSSTINNSYNSNNNNINGDHNEIHHYHQESNLNLYNNKKQQQQQEYNNHQHQKPSNLQSYNLQMMSTASGALQLNETTKVATTTSKTTNNINGHDHHLNSHNNNNNNNNNYNNNNNNNNNLNNCGNSSNINDQHSTISTVIASATVFTNIEPSLKLSNLMKSSQSNNNDRSSPHSFIQINKNSINNFSITSATAATAAKKNIIKTQQKDKKSSISIVQKVQQQQQKQNQFENEITSSPSTSTISSSSSPPSSSSLLFSSSASAITSATIASVQSFCNNSSNNRTIQQNSHHFKQQKEIQQQQQQSPQIINQPTSINSNSNSNCVGVKGITEVGGFKHNNNSSSLITNGGGDVEDMTMDQRGKYLDFNFQRSRSASTDDLSIDWDEHNQAAADETCEWRRVSKIRRSFQFPKTNSPPKSSPFTRPNDLPENCVSVSRIREELEKGRRLNAAMSHNIVDLQAVENILNGSNSNEYDQESSKSLKKSPSFLTAESLKEIRGRLKKLSDESLYKDDFVISQPINNDSNRISSLQTQDQILSGVNISKDSPLSSQMVRQQNAFQYYPKNSQQNNHTTNSLENRATRLKDTSSAEWHIRRKSYGFEKMSPPDNKMFRMESSTDSGLGRSSDLGNLSPTEHRGTVITFNESTGSTLNGTNKNATTVILNADKELMNSKPLVQRRYRDPNKINLSPDETLEVKRHSIAVDETKYVRENLRRVFDNQNSTGANVAHLNRLYLKEDNGNTSVSLDESQRNQRKRVEFCKTEVHFAAESGRVNIVETDGKPPPSNNFRRRRRSSGNAYIDAITSGLQVTHFGDESRSNPDAQDQADPNKSESTNVIGEKNSVTVSIPSVFNEKEIQPLTNYVGKISPDDNEDQDEISLRGILKNKPIKPKPYHLGENIIGNDNLWGVKLKSVTENGSTEPSKLKPLARILDEHDYDKEKLSNLKSVAEHVRIVEERKDVNGSYSTKINLSLTDKPFTWNSVEPTEDEIKKPVAIPRKKSTRPLSMGSFPLNQNSHLGRISEMIHSSDMESDDSVQAADEEVKRYLSNELLDQLDEEENSNQLVANSWNRLKAEKSTIKSEKIDIKDIPKSNVMSIKLQSPQSNRKTFTNLHESSKNIQTPVPVAKPRTSIQNIKSPLPTNDSKTNKNSIKVSPLPAVQAQLSPTKLPLESLKIEANGARKLREHELLYFGVKINNEEEFNQHHINNFHNTKSRNQPIQSTNNETNRKLHNNPKIIEETTNSSTKWKLACDKPDLLRHSPMDKNNAPTSLSLKDQKLNQITKTNGILMQDEDTEEDEDEEAYTGPIYENLKLPYPYNRKDDLIRDEMILCEMTKAADQTMKTVIDAHKIQKRRERRRSEQRQSQPLDTIEEKISPSSRLNTNHHESEKSYLQQTENSQRRSSLSRRSSSASSTGSFSDSGSLCGRSSRSRSKEKLLDSNDHKGKPKSILATKVKPRTSRTSKESASIKSPIAVTVRRIVEHRSSSQESQRSHKSSNENLQIMPPQKLERRHKRQTATPSKTVKTTSEKYCKDSNELSRHKTERSSTESNDRHRISKTTRNQTGVISSDDHVKKTHSSNRTAGNSDSIKNSKITSSRSNKESTNSDNNKMIRNSSRLAKELRDTEGRSISEHRRNRSSHDRKESSERHVNSRALRSEKEDHHRSSTRSDRATRATSLDNLRSSNRSQKLEDSEKIVRSKDKLSSNCHEHHKTSSSSTNKTSIQHGTKTATIPALTTTSNGHHHGTTYVSENPLVTRIIPPPRKKRLKNNLNSNNNNNCNSNNSKSKTQTFYDNLRNINRKLSKNLSPQYTNSTTSSFVFYPSSTTISTTLKKSDSKMGTQYERPLLSPSPDDFLKTYDEDNDDYVNIDNDNIYDNFIDHENSNDHKCKKFEKDLYNNLEQMKMKQNLSLNTKDSDIIDYYFKTKRDRDGKAQYVMVQSKPYHHLRHQHHNHQLHYHQQHQRQSQCGICTCS